METRRDPAERSRCSPRDLSIAASNSANALAIGGDGADDGGSVAVGKAQHGLQFRAPRGPRPAGRPC